MTGLTWSAQLLGVWLVLASYRCYQAVSRPDHQRGPATPGHLRGLTRVTRNTKIHQLTSFTKGGWCKSSLIVQLNTCSHFVPYLSSAVAAQPLEVLLVGEVTR